MIARPDIHPSSFILSPAPIRVGFFASFASTASQPNQTMGYDDGFRMICVYLCVTAVSPEFRDEARGVARRTIRTIYQSGGNAGCGRVFAVCRWLCSASAATRKSQAIGQFRRERVGGRSLRNLHLRLFPGQGEQFSLRQPHNVGHDSTWPSIADMQAARTIHNRPRTRDNALSRFLNDRHFSPVSCLNASLFVSPCSVQPLVLEEPAQSAASAGNGGRFRCAIRFRRELRAHPPLTSASISPRSTGTSSAPSGMSTGTFTRPSSLTGPGRSDAGGGSIVTVSS